MHAWKYLTYKYMHACVCVCVCVCVCACVHVCVCVCVNAFTSLRSKEISATNVM